MFEDLKESFLDHLYTYCLRSFEKFFNFFIKKTSRIFLHFTIFKEISLNIPKNLFLYLRTSNSGKGVKGVNMECRACYIARLTELHKKISQNKFIDLTHSTNMVLYLLPCDARICRI